MYFQVGKQNFSSNPPRLLFLFHQFVLQIMLSIKQHLCIAASIFATAAHAQNAADTLRSNQLQEVVLTGIRAEKSTPVTQYNINSKQLKQLYYGADLPLVLQNAPAIHAYSDNGTGIGYSFFRLRGIDQTRINLTINGVPVNDPENQGTFFNNFADLASSAQSVQIQRGVGTSTNGAAAFGGSINILTRNLSETPEAEINLGYGSFNSRRITAEAQTGRMADKYAMYVRLSNVATDGYRDRSGSEVLSYLFSAARFGEKSLLKFNAWGGDAQSQLAYAGVDEQQLNTNRMFNPLSQNERDRFQQHFFQLQYHYVLSKFSGINASAYYVRGLAPQFQVYFAASPFFPYSFYNMPIAISGTDTFTETNAMVSYRLNQHFYGGFANYYYQTAKLKWDAGIHANTFSSDHFMEVQNMDVFPAGFTSGHRAYFNTGYKQEASAFVKLNYAITNRWNVFTDVQARIARFQYKPQTMQYAAPPFTSEDMQWTFINPKAGTSYNISDIVDVYAMWGMTSREPTRFDYFQDDYATRDVKQNDIKSEQVSDWEAGMRMQSATMQMNANVYYMQFNNAIINTGQINAFGYPITTNVAQSTRTGIELDAQWKLNKIFALTHASNFSSNNIKSITQYYTDTNFNSVGFAYNNTAPALTPAMIINQGVQLMPVQWLSAEMNMRYVSDQFIDNSNNNKAKVPAYTVADLRLSIQLQQWLKQRVSISFHINNVLNTQYNAWGNTAMFSNVVDYRPDGSTAGTITPVYFVAPPSNFFITITWKI
jgi:iron complex outermembrane receptor protein